MQMASERKNNRPVIHRETHGHESEVFQSYFEDSKYGQKHSTL